METDDRQTPDTPSLHALIVSIADRFSIDSVRDEASVPAPCSDPVLAVVGEFSTGKSTLVNFLVRRHVMPVSAKPTTQFPVELRDGPEMAFHLTSAGLEISQAVDADAFSAAASQDGDAEAYSLGTVDLPSAFLKGGLVVVDTPGVASATDLHADVTFGYLPRADAILVVLNASQSVPKSVLAFIRQNVLPHDPSRLIFVVNQLGLSPDSQRDGMLSVIEQTLATVVRSPLVLPLTVAKADAQAFDSLSEADRARVGLTAIETALDRLLVDKRDEVLQARESRRLHALGRQLLSYLNTAIEGLDAGSDAAIAEEIDSHKTTLQEILADLSSRQTRLLADADEVVRHLKSAFAPRIATVRAFADTTLRQEMDRPGAGGSLEDRLEKAGRDSFTGRVTEALHEQIQDFRSKDLAPALTDLQARWTEDVTTGLAALDGNVDAELALDVSSPHNPLVEGAVDLALIVLLDFVLPGGFLVAIIGRVAGEKVIEKIRKPIVDAIEAIFLGSVTKPFMTKAIMAQVDATLARAQDQVMEAVQGTLRTAADGLTDALKARFQTATAERSKLLEDARRRRDAGVEAVRTHKRAIDDARRTLTTALA